MLALLDKSGNTSLDWFGEGGLKMNDNNGSGTLLDVRLVDSGSSIRDCKYFLVPGENAEYDSSL